MNTRSEIRKQIIKLTLPIVIQNLLSAAVSSADVIMLNYVGQSSISAVSLAAQYTNVLFMVYYGLGTGVTLLCAQYYGKKDMAAIRALEGICLRFSLTMSVIFAAMAMFIPRQLMTIFTNDPELITIGASYLRVLSVAYLCWGILEVYVAILRSIGRVTVCMFLNAMAFTLNVGLNAVFIFGLFGAPKLGATGVAIATSISRVVELIGCIIVSMCNKEIKLNLLYMFKKNAVLQSDFIRLALPALCNDVVWGAAFSMYSVILGHLGNDAVAANSIVVVVRNFSTTFCFALATGSSVLLGNIIGENKMEEAEICGSESVKMTVVTGIIGGVITLALTPVVLSFADLTETAMGYLKVMLLINSYYVMGAAVNTTMIAGIFRAGGDTKFGFICDTIDMWVYAVPLGFFAAFVLKLPVLWVYFLLCTDEFVKWPWVFKRYFSKKWLKNITRDNVATD